nr:reverse transcriptase domain-containing protein [Tanacetum cinerariifolium]
MPANIKLYDGTTDLKDHLSRFSFAANSGEWPMPVWCRMFQRTLDGSGRGWFKKLSGGSIDGWVELMQQFTTRFSTKRACFKDPTKITRIVRKANETLVAFKERWIIEIGFIMGVLEVMKISSFMDAHKCPKLAKQYSNKVPKTVDEMVTRLDDFVRSEEVFASTVLPKGEVSKASRKSTRPVSRREDRFHMGGYETDKRRNKRRGTFSNMDGLVSYHPKPRIRHLGIEGSIIPDASDEPLIIEALMEGYLVRKVTLKEHPDGFGGFRRRRGETIRENRVGGGFNDGGLFRTVMINFTIVRAPSPYNVIFGRTNLRSIRAVSSTIHSMVKFLTPWGIATLVTRSAIISECQRLEKKQMVEHEVNQNINQENEVPKRVDLTEQTLVNLAYPDQLATIRGNLSEEYAYKGYHQVQMAQDNENKTAFYTDQGTHCYTKLSFGLKNTGAIYQRLVDATFQSQIKRNLKAYVDDMVIKSNEEKVLIADIAETFDNLRRINMKLNPKKCSFVVEEGKFLGCMVTSEGIQPDPKKTKAIADMQSPRTLKETQSLSGKLAVLKKFLSRSAEKSLPFFETLKDITKENKDIYRWTESAKKAFQELKKVIVEFSLLTTSVKEETLYVYMAAATGAVSVLFLTERKGKQCSIHYVSTTLNEAEKNYAPLKKLAMSLLHMSKSTNNEAEYEALLARLHMARKMKVQDIDVKVDSKLVASQINESYVASTTNMIKYLATVKECIAEFKTCAIQNIPRNLNQKDDILSKLATHAFDRLTKKVLVEVLAKRSNYQKEVGAIIEEEADNCMTPIICFLGEGVWPKDKDKRRALRRKINQYVLEEGRYTWDLTKCISKRDTCSGTETPQNIDDFNHGPVAIYQWGMDILSPLPQAAKKLKFIVISIDYFTKWIKAKPLARIIEKDVKKFAWDNIAREAAAIREAKYKTKMEQYYNRKVRPMSFKSDKYVFRRNEASRVENQDKL